MSVLDLEKLIETLQRGGLTPSQEAQLESYLSAHPEQRQRFEEELGLNYLLQGLSNAPVSSNFTARVLQQARQQVSRPDPDSPTWRPSWTRAWLPRLATTAAVVAICLLGYRHHQVTERKQLAQRLARLSELASEAPPLELLENFQAIQRLSQAPHDTDRELIAALQ